MNISFRVAREAKASTKSTVKAARAARRQPSRSRSRVWSFWTLREPRACERDSVGFGCSVDKRSLAATLGLSGSVNVQHGRPSERETEKGSEWARAWRERDSDSDSKTVREAAKLGRHSRRKEKQSWAEQRKLQHTAKSARARPSSRRSWLEERYEKK